MFTDIFFFSSLMIFGDSLRQANIGYRC